MKKYARACLIVFAVASIVLLVAMNMTPMVGGIIYLQRTMRSDVKEFILYNDAEYTLWVENESIGAKFYVRLINGVHTDDYILVFYDSEGNLKSRNKSKFTLTDEDVAKAQALWEQMVSIDAPVCDISEFEDAEYQFKKINGELVLLLVVVTPHTIDNCSETIFYNALTGEVISKW